MNPLSVFPWPIFVPSWGFISKPVRSVTEADLQGDPAFIYLIQNAWHFIWISVIQSLEGQPVYTVVCAAGIPQCHSVQYSAGVQGELELAGLNPGCAELLIWAGGPQEVLHWPYTPRDNALQSPLIVYQ